MPRIEVFDPPMCCSTGVCGTDPNPMLARFSSDLEWLKQQGVDVRRYNLAQEPVAFTENAAIKNLLDETDGDGLPAILVDGQLVSKGSYPERDALAGLAKVAGDNGAAEEASDASPAAGASLMTPAVAELVALGAAVAGNCEACFEYHHQQATRLGVSEDDMIRAVNLGLRIKEVPHQSLMQSAQKALAPEQAQGQACCSGGGQSGGDANCC